jgi:tRNA-binding EMAP/Myf-like protein
VGVITKVWHHPAAERLFCEEIDVGEGAPRQIASGLREHFTLEQMQGRRVVVVTNLKPAKLVGFESNGERRGRGGGEGRGR